jgi:hypothetical protein
MLNRFASISRVLELTNDASRVQRFKADATGLATGFVKDCLRNNNFPTVE